MFNVTTRDNGTETETRNAAYALVFGCVIVLGLPLNALSLWIMLRRHSLKSPCAVFMVNLVISDLQLIISLPMRVYFYGTGTWPLSNLACVCITVLFRNNIRSSGIFITCITLDRLLAVVYPLRSRHLRTASNSWKAAALIWLAVLTISVPESVTFARSLKKFNETSCFEFRHEGQHESPLFYLQSVFLFILLAVNVVSTARVSWTLRGHLEDSARVDNHINVMVIFAMNLMMFAVFFLPVSLVILFNSREFVTPLVCLASVNCCVDPLLYYFSIDGFWKR